MKFLIVNTDYQGFLEQLYSTNPNLKGEAWHIQLQTRHASLFGMNDFRSKNLRLLGHEAHDIYFNNSWMQLAWAKDFGFKELVKQFYEQGNSTHWFYTALKTQIEYYRPDILWLDAMDGIDTKFLEQVKPLTRLLVGCGEPPVLLTQKNFGIYDLVLGPTAKMVDIFRQQNIGSELFLFGFEHSILDQLGHQSEKTIPISFVGNLSSFHSGRFELLEYLVGEGFDIRTWTMDLSGFDVKSRVSQTLQGQAFGQTMYQILRQSKITLNHHIDIAGPYADNMRLFEATGVGTLLITDAKINLPELFEPGKEVIAYQNPQECAEVIKYYLQHDSEREQISQAGQQRTLDIHTYYQRMQQFEDIAGKYLRQMPNCQSGQRPAYTPVSITETSFSKLKDIASKQRFGNWQVSFQGLTIFCHDLLSFYIAGKDIFLHRIYDFETPSPQLTVIDGGGHIGLFTLWTKNKYPHARILVFEPDDESRQLLQQNIRANKIEDVTVINAGLYQYNGEVPFGSDHSDGSSILSTEKTSTIKVVRLSEFINSEIDFLKLNIEGAELDVLVELGDKISLIKEMVIEYHGFPEAGQKLHTILEILDRSGFRYSLHDFDAETNPATKPPFKIKQETRFFQLIYAKRLFPVKAKPQISPNGHLSRVKPVSQLFGFDRGLPIDRYYIETFLEQNRAKIQGHVLEIGDGTYTQKYGQNVTQSDILNVTPADGTTIVGNLATGENIPTAAFDCIIMPQTIQMIFDVRSALENVFKALKPGGTLLLTASGISQISRYDMDRWGEYWRFTDKSLRTLFADYAPEYAIDVEAFGNVAVAKAFLDGLAASELPAHVLDYQDRDYQVTLVAKVQKQAPAMAKPAGNQVSSNQNSFDTPLILLYHRIADDPVNAQLLAVSPRNFEAHVKALSENYRIVSLRSLVAELRQGSLIPDTIALTFDDGYLDNLTNALPLLEKYQVPATIFVTSGMIGSKREFWWDALENIFFTGHDLPSELGINHPQGTRTWNLTSPQGRLQAADELGEFFRSRPVPEVKVFVDQLFSWASLPNIGRLSHRVVNCDQLKTLSQSPVIEIGAHTVTHTRLSALSTVKQQEEIQNSKRQLETIINKSVRLFSYPFGAPTDFTQETASLVAAAGFEAGIANIQGNIVEPVDLFAMPRRLVRDWSVDQLKQWLQSEDKNRLEEKTVFDVRHRMAQQPILKGATK